MRSVSPSIFVAYLAYLGLLVLAAAAPVRAEEASDDDAPAPPPAPVVRYSTLSTIDDSADALADALPFDEVEPVVEGDDRYWRVYRTAPRGERGVIVLAAAANVAPSARSLATLRQSLPGWGWTTVSVPLPEPPENLLPDRDRFAPEPPVDGDDADEESKQESRSRAADDSDEDVPPAVPKRPDPLTYDTDALAARQAELRRRHRQQLDARLTASVAAARSRSAGGPVVLLAADDAARWVVTAGESSGADALILVDLDVTSPERAAERTALADLTLPALVLQHAPTRWHPSHRLGSAVELHLLPVRSEQRLARRVHGYLKRNTKRAQPVASQDPATG